MSPAQTRARKNASPLIQAYSQAAEIPESSYGVVDDILVNKIPSDGSAVIIFFNGRISKAKLRNGPTFQRWSWSGLFNYPILFLSDPLVHKKSNIELGWYFGTKSQNFNQLTLERAQGIIDDLGLGAAKKICIGSSGGGFAAGMAASLGWSDVSVCINAQTDILKYYQGPVNAFLDYVGLVRDKMSDEERLRSSILESLSLNKFSRAIFFQNRFDGFHLREHFLPLVEAASKFPFHKQRQFSFRVYGDSTNRHAPPSIEETLSLIEEAVPGCINDIALRAARGETQIKT